MNHRFDTIEIVRVILFSLLVFSVSSCLAVEPLTFKPELAVEKANAIQLEHNTAYLNGLSHYYGTFWKKQAQRIELENSTLWEEYTKRLNQAGQNPRMMDCTLFCRECLKAGVNDSGWNRLLKLHDKHWNGKGFAGWSVGYILAHYFGWEAYLFIQDYSDNKSYYENHYEQHNTFPVYKQPNIPLKGVFNLPRDNEKVEKLLETKPFGWGFSEQGIHTWITTNTELRECRWDGAPAPEYDIFRVPLFIRHRFVHFYDYSVHVVVFPPEKSEVE